MSPPSGKVILRKYWDRKLLPGVTVRQAFPFLGKKLAIDDVVRFASLAPPARKAASGKQAAKRSPRSRCYLQYGWHHFLREPEPCERWPTL
jgi:hypothetical protein